MKSYNYTRKEFFLTSFILFIFWLVLSFPANPFSSLGKIDLLQHVVAGIILSLVLTWSFRLPIFTEKEIAAHSLSVIVRFLFYLFHLVVEIILAGVDVALRVLRKKLDISPGMVEFRTPLKDDIPITLNANSITLTPGTITIEAEKTADGDSIFLVHCISQKAVKSIMEEGGFVKRILSIYGG